MSAADPDSGVRVRADRDDYGLPAAPLPSLGRFESRIRLIHTVDERGDSTVQGMRRQLCPGKRHGTGSGRTRRQATTALAGRVPTEQGQVGHGRDDRDDGHGPSQHSHGVLGRAMDGHPADGSEMRAGIKFMACSGHVLAHRAAHVHAQQVHACGDPPGGVRPRTTGRTHRRRHGALTRAAPDMWPPSVARCSGHSARADRTARRHHRGDHRIPQTSRRGGHLPVRPAVAPPR